MQFMDLNAIFNRKFELRRSQYWLRWFRSYVVFHNMLTYRQSYRNQKQYPLRGILSVQRSVPTALHSQIELCFRNDSSAPTRRYTCGITNVIVLRVWNHLTLPVMVVFIINQFILISRGFKSKFLLFHTSTLVGTIFSHDSIFYHDSQ